MPACRIRARIARSVPTAAGFVATLGTAFTGCQGSDVFLGGGSMMTAGAPAASATGGQSGTGGASASGGAAGKSGVAGTSGAAAGPLGDFGPPRLIAELSDPDYDDDDPTLTADLTEIYFSSGRPGGLGGSDVWRATRASATGPWGPPVNVPELSSVGDETSVALSPDGLTLFIGTNREGGTGDFDIWQSTRRSLGSAWSLPVPVSELNTVGADVIRSMDATGLLLAGMTRPSDSSRFDLFFATRLDQASPWTDLSPVSEINTGDNEADPFLTPDAHMLFFTASRASTEGDDLFVTTRGSAQGPFGAIEPLVQLNGPGRDSDAWVSEDLRVIYFASDRDGDLLNIYEASR